MYKPWADPVADQPEVYDIFNALGGMPAENWDDDDYEINQEEIEIPEPVTNVPTTEGECDTQRPNTNRSGSGPGA